MRMRLRRRHGGSTELLSAVSGGIQGLAGVSPGAQQRQFGFYPQAAQKWLE